MFLGKSEEYTGGLIEGFLAAVDAAGFERVNAAAPVGVLLAAKDEDEILAMKLAAKLSSDVLGRVVKVRVLDIIDDERKEKHADIADEVEKFITETDNDKYAKHAKKLKLDTDLLESCFSPIIQSAGQFNLKVSAQSDDAVLQQGVIVGVVGARYKSYCSNAARTFIVGEPTKAQEKNYKFLLEVHEEAMKTMQDGKAVAGVYARVKEFVAENRPDLSKHLTKNAGFAMGIDFRESALVLNEKCKENFAANMVFNLAIGFSGIENEDGKTAAERVYALFVADTYLVTKSEPELLTPTKKQYDDICFEFKNEDDDEEEAEAAGAEAEAKKREMLAKLEAETGGRRRAGGSSAGPEGESAVAKEERMRKNQAELSVDLEREAKRRLLKQTEEIMHRAKTKDTPTCYKRFDQMDSDQNRSLKIYVDKSRGAVVFPVYGMPVPFHVAYVTTLFSPPHSFLNNSRSLSGGLRRPPLKGGVGSTTISGPLGSVASYLIYADVPAAHSDDAS